MKVVNLNFVFFVLHNDLTQHFQLTATTLTLLRLAITKIVRLSTDSLVGEYVTLCLAAMMDFLLWKRSSHANPTAVSRRVDAWPALDLPPQFLDPEEPIPTQRQDATRGARPPPLIPVQRVNQDETL
ncbi:hypothetical protein TNCV_1507521 [Trichonephila clavipes]|nr:hypothetical protein TNCV_1507521 [Trichonephila clavipes]